MSVALLLRRSLYSALCVISISGCSQLPALWGEGASVPAGMPETLGDLREKALPDDLPQALIAMPDRTAMPGLPTASAPQVDGLDFTAMEAVIDRYRQLLPLSPPEERRAIAVRIGDLLVRKTDRLISSDRPTEAVQLKALQQRERTALQETRAHLQVLYADRSDQSAAVDAEAEAHVFYQYAKVLEFAGQREQSIAVLESLVNAYPDNTYTYESWFRIGEHYFTERQYARAEHAFTQIILGIEGASTTRSDEIAYLLQANYMGGWSLFKQGRYDQALKRFIRYMDQVWAEGALTESGGRVAQAKDVARVMVIALDYLGGAEAVLALFDEVGTRTYEAVLYQRYVEWLKEKDRISEAMTLCDAYLTAHPKTRYSAGFSAQKIFLGEHLLGRRGLWEDKATYLRAFGPDVAELFSSEMAGADPDIWVNANDWQWDRNTVSRRYAEALAEHFYLEAQRNQTQDQRSPEKHFIQAAGYYEVMVRWWPQDSAVGKYRFLQAESLFGGQQFADAARVYEIIAYGETSHQQSETERREAAFALIETRRRVATSEPNDPALLQALLTAEVAFVQSFERDKRAAGVYSDALTLAAQLQQPEQTLTLAEALERAAIHQSIQGVSPAERAQLLRIAFTHQAESLLALQAFERLESTITRALDSVTWERSKGAELNHLKGLALYRQAEAKEESAVREAVALYLQAANISPQSTFAQAARQDAIALLLSEEAWEQAIPLLERYITDYPKPALAQSMTVKLATAQEALGQWERAASTWPQVSLAPPPEFARSEREQQWHIAQLYDKAGNVAQSIQHYRRYAHAYPDPITQVMEARSRLIDLYGGQNEPSKQAFWVAKVLQDYAKREDQVGEVSIQVVQKAVRLDLTAKQNTYTRVRLTPPLKTSLLKKKNALQALLQTITLLARSGDEAVKTESIYLTGEIYRDLASQLLSAPAPKGLNDLEQSQYDLLLEELAFPFEEKAIELHESNTVRLAAGQLNTWTEKSLGALRRLLPARYDKRERLVTYSEQIN